MVGICKHVPGWAVKKKKNWGEIQENSSLELLLVLPTFFVMLINLHSFDKFSFFPVIENVLCFCWVKSLVLQVLVFSGLKCLSTGNFFLMIEAFNAFIYLNNC